MILQDKLDRFLIFLFRCHGTFKLRVFHLWQTNFASRQKSTGSPARSLLITNKIYRPRSCGITAVIPLSPSHATVYSRATLLAHVIATSDYIIYRLWESWIKWLCHLSSAMASKLTTANSLQDYVRIAFHTEMLAATVTSSRGQFNHTSGMHGPLCWSLSQWHF